MNAINASEIRATWSPIIESATGINDSEKLAWMSEYCHNHKLYEDANGAVNYMVTGTSMNLGGMGATALPNPANFATKGSGDKAPTLLPLAMQVAAQTVGLDLVPVVPMQGPMGVLTYLDFVYGGGLTTAANGLASKAAPLMIKAPVTLDSGVAEFVANNGGKISTMVRYEVGEGMEKRQENFAEEVAKQRDEMIKANFEKNSFISEMVDIASKKSNDTLLPVPFESHILNWKAECKRRK